MIHSPLTTEAEKFLLTLVQNKQQLVPTREAKNWQLNRATGAVKSFLNTSAITDLHRALGQYVLYEVLLEELESDRQVCLAISQEAYEGIFSEAIGQLLLARRKLKLIIFDIEQAKIVQWIN